MTLLHVTLVSVAAAMVAVKSRHLPVQLAAFTIAVAAGIALPLTGMG